jgi:hypothetical protein
MNDTTNPTPQPKKVATRKGQNAKKPPAAKPAPAIVATKTTKAPPQREAQTGDRDYTVSLRPRHADWVELAARMNGRTVPQQLEKIVREAYAADPNSKTGASVHSGSDAGAQLQTEKQQAAAP